MAKVQQEIRANREGGRIAAALSVEGYAGGYLDALRDVEAILNGVPPADKGDYWQTGGER